MNLGSLIQSVDAVGFRYFCLFFLVLLAYPLIQLDSRHLYLRYIVLQCVAVCCSVWDTLFLFVFLVVLAYFRLFLVISICGTLCCSVLQCVAVCTLFLFVFLVLLAYFRLFLVISICGTLCCSVLQCVAVCTLFLFVFLVLLAYFRGSFDKLLHARVAKFACGSS